jgi:tetratricopeptide (TPR) repeat protein
VDQLKEKPANRLALFLGASLAIKNSASAEALKLLNTLEAQTAGLPLEYASYLKGEVYLHRAEYLNAISSYRWFINHYKGQNYVKDAHYKIGLCYWLNGNTSDAQVLFKQARTIGKESSEADRYAARSLGENELPHIKLTKARYFTDGGYLTEAAALLGTITPAELPTKRDQVEFVYRKARLSHKMKDLKEATEYYAETIRLSGTEQWYFAPNACLQLGYLALANNDRQAAALHFRKALEYKKHEYKNSIDSKAKSALAQLNKRK